MSDGLISFYVAQQNVREHSFSVDVVIDSQYTKTSVVRILPQIPVLETLIFFQEIFEKPMQTEEVAA